jgi:hypothetical protein
VAHIVCLQVRVPKERQLQLLAASSAAHFRHGEPFHELAIFSYQPPRPGRWPVLIASVAACSTLSATLPA